MRDAGAAHECTHALSPHTSTITPHPHHTAHLVRAHGCSQIVCRRKGHHGADAGAQRVPRHPHLRRRAAAVHHQRIQGRLRRGPDLQRRRAGRLGGGRGQACAAPQLLDHSKAVPALKLKKTGSSRPASRRPSQPPHLLEDGGEAKGHVAAKDSLDLGVGCLRWQAAGMGGVPTRGRRDRSEAAQASCMERGHLA